jgi:APA family basic amino acid/polyamine antiporter
MAEHTRTLDFKIAFAIGLGTMIAAGIFSLSGTAVARIGSSAVIAFVIAAVIAGITAASYSEFASIYSENGGGYLFTSRTFEDRDLLTYGIGMSLFLGYTGTTAFYLATMDEWFFGFIVPESLQFLPHGTWGVAAALLLGTLNARGTEESGSFQLIVTGAKVAVLFAFIAGAFAYRGPVTATTNFTTGFEAEPVGIVSVAALAFITFFGFSAIAASAGEIIEPRKTVPRAIAASILTVTVLYALVIVAMVNSTVPPEVIARQGETAMGEVARGFLGPIGQSLIVAGAVFSMVSASNASILAASGIGSLMGRQGQAPRRFSRIHPKHGTPFWSVTTATATIVTLIVVFITLLGQHGAVGPIPVGLDVAVGGIQVAVEEFALGLTTLTGFATLNLLLPLAVVNVTLIYHRRAFPDIERGFRVPGVPVVPILGVLANLALIYNLPVVGVVTGLLLTGALLGVYLVWGGAPDVEELFERVPSPAAAEPGGAPEAGGTAPESGERPGLAEEVAAERHRTLVPVADIANAPRYVRLAAALVPDEDDPLVEVINVMEIPEQTPHEVVADEAEARAAELDETLAEADIGVDYVAETHTCRDVAFDILQTARDDDVDRILMGYPEEHREITEKVEYEAPCDVLFVSGFADRADATGAELATVTVGAGGGPHHSASLSMVRALGTAGTDIHVVSVDPTEGGTAEDPGDTISDLHDMDVHVHNVSANTVAKGLVDAAAERGGVLVIGASRDRRLRQWIFGSTPDRVVALAAGAGVPVVVYASNTGVPERLEDYLFPVYRAVRRLLRSDGDRSVDGSTN